MLINWCLHLGNPFNPQWPVTSLSHQPPLWPFSHTHTLLRGLGSEVGTAGLSPPLPLGWCDRHRGRQRSLIVLKEREGINEACVWGNLARPRQLETTHCCANTHAHRHIRTHICSSLAHTHKHTHPLAQKNCQMHTYYMHKTAVCIWHVCACAIVLVSLRAVCDK